MSTNIQCIQLPFYATIVMILFSILFLSLKLKNFKKFSLEAELLAVEALGSLKMSKTTSWL